MSITLKEVQESGSPTIPVQTGAELAGIDVRTFRKGIEDGTIPAIRIGKRVLVLREPFLALLGVTND
ncbi:MerR family transcriptional regulator [Rhodococcus erythropolis]|uniref:DNA-binding protein n=1 Tax=Rhodococcus erythropolis TaxID=1833 RepID=UPI003670D985